MYAEDTAVGRLKREVEDSEIKTNVKYTENIAMSKQKIARYELQIGEVNIILFQNFKYLESDLSSSSSGRERSGIHGTLSSSILVIRCIWKIVQSGSRVFNQMANVYLLSSTNNDQQILVFLGV